MVSNKSKQSTNAAPTHVALLRGINVGGKRLLPRKVLVAAFDQAGCRSISTYIQSGNVVFAADAALAKRLVEEIPKRIGKAVGFEPVVVVRSKKEYAAIVRNNPFLPAGADEAALHVGFLAKAPAKADIGRLDPNRSPGDDFVVRGNVIYLHLRHGAGSTKLTSAYLDSKLNTTCTARNWRTTLKLAEMLGID